MILQVAHLRGAGDLIEVLVQGADLTVSNSVDFAMAAGRKRLLNEIFPGAGSAARLDVENSYVENVCCGVWLRGYLGSRSDPNHRCSRSPRSRSEWAIEQRQGGYLPARGSRQAGFLILTGEGWGRYMPVYLLHFRVTVPHLDLGYRFRGKPGAGSPSEARCSCYQR